MSTYLALARNSVNMGIGGRTNHSSLSRPCSASSRGCSGVNKAPERSLNEWRSTKEAPVTRSEFMFDSALDCVFAYRNPPIQQLKAAFWDWEAIECRTPVKAPREFLSDLGRNKWLWAQWVINGTLASYGGLERQAFLLRYVGRLSGGKIDLRDRLGVQQIAEELGISRFKVGRITGRILDEIEADLIRRGLMQGEIQK